MMRLVDAHVHVGRQKYPPVEDCLTAMTRAGVGQAVLVQYVGNTDNRYLHECRTRHPGRFALVGMVDPERPDAPDQVDRLAAAGFAGVRLWATTRSPGADPLAVWRALDRNHLVASVRGPFADIAHPDFAALLDEVPGLVVRMEHLGFFRYGVDAGFDAFLRLADRPGVCTMWSGYHAYSSAGHPYPDATPYLRASLAAYGPERVMWSGDWNRDRTATDDEYDAAVEHVTEHLDFLTEADREWILGRTAATVFGLEGAP
ncbi:Predicted metal-dependent hydrolase, TIM-barrel fold [Actinopolymorpha cephalotaxi]|uniref:Predicted metal-dependent hydrolase, TIM-barrel fold n=1 Tax=Actinopolymorpha cephalotaxi TaxID=504797 RepID=A0A1I2ZXC0_9ACTN|nr:amidohydrolase family protein [Actinopolymorpha cephalotaxi]NYH84215.1 putative TIM-barrel fold metal-dependent hydrolase [Actinopolymorpha cephalotaxi]SFH42295.1 Predicted metal-dependent hydrolase, TIM-barrel fold [Actinopolymorpha cephalotaxi]